MAPSFDIDDVMPTLTRKSIAIIRERAQVKDKPFFLYFAMTGPHTPWLPIRRFRGKSGAGDYGDFVMQIDKAVGDVIRTVEESGAARRTLVIFPSDNGAYWPPDEIERYAHRANNGWRGMKADIFEGGHRVPFIAAWPGVLPAGQVRGELGCLSDVYATVADAIDAGLPSSAAEDSFSLLPAVKGSAVAKGRDSVIHHSAEGMFAIRSGRWKLIEGHGSGGFTIPVRVDAAPDEPIGELYDIVADPAETQNLWKSEPAVVERLRRMLEETRRSGRQR
jgi:arylsulfatase A-like enzyme